MQNPIDVQDQPSHSASSSHTNPPQESGTRNYYIFLLKTGINPDEAILKKYKEEVKPYPYNKIKGCDEYEKPEGYNAHIYRGTIMLDYPETMNFLELNKEGEEYSLKRNEESFWIDDQNRIFKDIRTYTLLFIQVDVNMFNATAQAQELRWFVFSFNRGYLLLNKSENVIERNFGRKVCINALETILQTDASKVDVTSSRKKVQQSAGISQLLSGEIGEIFHSFAGITKETHQNVVKQVAGENALAAKGLNNIQQLPKICILAYDRSKSSEYRENFAILHAESRVKLIEDEDKIKELDTKLEGQISDQYIKDLEDTYYRYLEKSHNRLDSYNDYKFPTADHELFLKECEAHKEKPGLEKWYNNKFRVNNPNLLCMDNKNIYMRNSTAIELCDLLSIDKHLIHVKVKRYKRSASAISYLFHQGVASAQLLKDLPEFREKSRSKIEKVANEQEKTEDFKNVIHEPFKPSDYTIVYNIITSKLPNLTSSENPKTRPKPPLSLSELIAFNKAANILRNFDYKIKIMWTQYVNEPGTKEILS